MTRNHSGWVLLLASIASCMTALDTLVVASALSTIQADLGASLEQLEWTVNAYNLSFAVLLMTGAALGDRFGRRRLYGLGLAIFTAASAACALAPDVGWLIAARAIQGAGAALLIPLGLALLSAAFPPAKRGAAIGVFSAITGVSVALGPLVGGAVVQGISWEWIFWLNVPIGLVALPFLIAGAALAGGFVAWQLRVRAPMIPPALFRSRAFSAGNVATFFVFGSLFADVFFYSQLLQTGLGHDPLAAGLRLMPWTATFITVAPVAGNLADRIGSRPLLVGGLLLHAAGMIWLALIAEPGMAYTSLLGPFLLGGAGVSMAIPAAQTAVLAGVAPDALGKAAGANSMLRELGGVFGIAIAAAVFAGAGSYASPQAFIDGFGPAVGVAAGLALAGAVAALVLPARNTALAVPALQPEEA